MNRSAWEFKKGIGNLGSSLGTALIGSLPMVTLMTVFMGDVTASNLSSRHQDYIGEFIEHKYRFN